MGNFLFIFGIVVVALAVAAGIYINVSQKFSIPRLPGDIFIKKGNFILYFPITTSLIISFIVSLVLKFLK